MKNLGLMLAVMIPEGHQKNIERHPKIKGMRSGVGFLGLAWFTDHPQLPLFFAQSGLVLGPWALLHFVLWFPLLKVLADELAQAVLIGLKPLHQNSVSRHRIDWSAGSGLPELQMELEFILEFLPQRLKREKKTFDR